MKARKNGFGTVALLVGAAQIALPTCVRNRLEACPLTNLKVVDLVAYFDDNAGTLMASTDCAVLRHRAQAPVIHHEMKVAVTDTRCVELDEHILWAYEENNFSTS
jgi:hypothetical protein